jgi:hypothetical protein
MARSGLACLSLHAKARLIPAIRAVNGERKRGGKNAVHVRGSLSEF